MGSPAHVKSGIRGKSLLKPSEDIANFPGSQSPEDLIDAALTKAGQAGEFTAARLEKRKPDVYRAACFAIAQGIPFTQIAYLLKISVGSICAIAERECDKLPPAKETILTKTKVAARLAVERVTDEIQEMDGKSAAIAYGILTDKMLLLSGEANVIVAKQQDIPTHQDFNAMIAALPKADVKEIDASPIAPTAPDTRSSAAPPVVDATPTPPTISQTTPQQ